MYHGKKKKHTESTYTGRRLAHTYTHRGSARRDSEITTDTGASESTESGNQGMHADRGNVQALRGCGSRYIAGDAGERGTAGDGKNTKGEIFPPFELGGES